jgi:hypothetical protein
MRSKAADRTASIGPPSSGISSPRSFRKSSFGLSRIVDGSEKRSCAPSLRSPWTSIAISTQSDARECKTWIGPQEFVREYVVMDDTLRIDEFDDGDTDTDECRDDVEEDRRRNISDGAIHPRGSFAFDRKPNHPTDVLVNTGTLLTGVRYPEKPHRTKSFSVECVGREHDIESTITDQVHRTIEELREDTDRLAPSSAGAKEMIQVEVKVFRQLHEPPSSIETYSKSSHVTMDQLEVPKSPSMGSWFWRWSTKGCWSYGL